MAAGVLWQGPSVDWQRFFLLAAAVVGAAAADQAGVGPVLWLPVALLLLFLIFRATGKTGGDAVGGAGGEPRRLGPLKVRPTQPEAVADAISIAALADPALVVSTAWRVVAANEGALQLFGQRIVGADLRQTVRHPIVVDAVRLGIGGESPAPREVSTLGARNGAFRVRVVPLDETRLLLSFTDITQARMAERMRADFVANASHELRTPLATILGFLETLLGPAADDEPARRRFLEIMSGEAARMSRLIDDLLSLSRIELDKHVRPQTRIDLAPLMADVGRTLAMQLAGDDRRLVLDVEPGLPQVLGDRDQLLQVLHNLVSNALKYGRTGTPITISAVREAGASARAEEMLRIRVADVGDGIAAEHLPRLTERFYRIDTGRSRSMGGTGLGLAIVKHIVERHRGRLEIASRQGEGTTVSFLLPAVAALPDAAGMLPSEAGPLPFGGEGDAVTKAQQDRHISRSQGAALGALGGPPWLGDPAMR